MGLTIFLKDYIIWHYSTAPKEGAKICKNFLWFISQFFSIKLLLKTLFQPLKRMREYYGRGFDPAKYLETLAMNSIMRLVGLVARLLIIAVGLTAELMAIAAGTIIFFAWLFLPLLITWFLVKGLAIFI